MRVQNAGWDVNLRSWTFLSNHGLVLTFVAEHPSSTGLEIGQAVGLTERAVRKILGDLQDAGYVVAERVGRRNRYGIDPSLPLLALGRRSVTVGDILTLVERADGDA